METVTVTVGNGFPDYQSTGDNDDDNDSDNDNDNDKRIGR